MEMKFLPLLKHNDDLDSINGYDDVKNILKRALDSEDNYNLLFSGPPAQTLFLLGIMEREKKAVYFDGSNTSNRIRVLDPHRRA